jgi:hypothetical protein
LSVCWGVACRGCGCCPCGGERGVERVLGGGLQGVRLPVDVRRCPLCAGERTNAALCSTSGYVFCYPCIYRHVEAHGSCPVTLEQTAVEDVWKIYQDS